MTTDLIAAVAIIIIVPAVIVALAAMMIYGPSWLILKWLDRL